MLWEIDGIGVGHTTNEAARTGCTVVLLPDGTVASGEVRGGAPATREFALLDPARMVDRLDAVVLTGGSAFGLAAADGVVSWCEQAERGFTTAAGPVPIVVAMALYDLADGDPSVRPTADDGRTAAEAALHSAGQAAPLGQVGAGTGATIEKWRGPDHRQRGGLVGAIVRSGQLAVAALVAVNASGTVDDGSLAQEVRSGRYVEPVLDDRQRFENTTIGVVATNASLTKTQCLLVAQGAHRGLARAIRPSHTQGDGDAFVAAATGVVEAGVATVSLLAATAVEDAIRTVTSYEPRRP